MEKVLLFTQTQVGGVPATQFKPKLISHWQILLESGFELAVQVRAHEFSY